MLFDQRVLFSDNGLIRDISVSVASFKASSELIEVVAAEDYIYIGSYLPFNHKWFDLSVPNIEASSVAIEIWDGDSWHSVVDILDQTEVGSASFGKSGIIRFVHDRDETWSRELDSYEVMGLESTELYSLYWSRMTWTADFSALVSLNFIGQKFSDDSDLYLYYPDLNNSDLKTAFASGKTTWDEQSFMAGDRLGRDLRRNNSIVTSDQILDYELFNEASVHKTAEIIFYGLGASYVDLRDRAETKYKEALNQSFLNLDRNADGDLSGSERRFRQGFLTR